MGKPYRHAKLVLYRGQTYSGCGTAQAQTGPFYCPQDEKIYIDLSFWDELKRFGGSTTEFAQAYVITHELGHHVQKLLGIEGREARLAHAGTQLNAIPLSVDLELQADCLSGASGHTPRAQRGFVHPGRHSGCALRRRSRGRRPSRADVGPRRQPGIVDAWIERAERSTVVYGLGLKGGNGAVVSRRLMEHLAPQ